jgi:large subunit ribosomal protein L29
MKNKEIKKLSSDELKNKVTSLKKDLFNMRFKRVNGQLTDTAKVSETKKSVAKLLTAINKSKLHHD